MVTHPSVSPLKRGVLVKPGSYIIPLFRGVPRAERGAGCVTGYEVGDAGLGSVEGHLGREEAEFKVAFV
jgi:hypothetical protein